MKTESPGTPPLRKPVGRPALTVSYALRGSIFAGAEVVTFRGVETLSKLYRFDVDFTSEDDLFAHAVPRSQMLRQRVELVVTAADVSRTIRGVVAAIEPREATSYQSHSARAWRMRVVPSLWLAKHRVRSRIFRGLSTPEIVHRVVTSHEYALPPPKSRLSAEYPPRDFCMQYRESDYAFVRRLLSEEGIAWYFDHSGDLLGDSDVEGDVPGIERLVLVDAPDYQPLAPVDDEGNPFTLVHQQDGSPDHHDRIATFVPSRVVRPTSTQLQDYDASHPARVPGGSAPVGDAGELPETGSVERWDGWSSDSRGSRSAGAYTTGGVGTDEDLQRDLDLRGWKNHAEVIGNQVADPAARRELRVYSHGSSLGPQRVDDRLAQVRLDELQRGDRELRGVAHAVQLAPGYRFAFEPDPSQVFVKVKGEYAVIKVEHDGATDDDDRSHRVRFRAVPAWVMRRPKLRKKKRWQHLETATVVGAEGSSVHVDDQGRVKVQFHWDRESDHDEQSSCWVRVVQPWAGTAYGAQFVPRVGSEVLVSFIDGDHDRPVVLGGVYNGAQPVPFKPPEGALRSGIRTQSVPGGSGYNELSFDDTQGEEQVRLRAEADFETYVGRDRATRVAGSARSRVEGRRTDEIGGDVETRVEGDARHHFEGALATEVGGGERRRIAQDLEVEVEGAAHNRVEGPSRTDLASDHTEAIDGHRASRVGLHDARRSAAHHVEGASVFHSQGMTEITAEAGLRLRCGSSMVEIMEDRILLRADRVMLHTSDAQVELDGGDLHTHTDAVAMKADSVKIRGMGAMLSLEAEAKLMGPTISLCRPEAVGGLEPVARETTVLELADEDGRPLPHQQYVLIFADGREQTGFLDGDGRAEVVLEEGAQVRFPGIVEVRSAG